MNLYSIFLKEKERWKDYDFELSISYNKNNNSLLYKVKNGENIGIKYDENFKISNIFYYDEDKKYKSYKYELNNLVNKEYLLKNFYHKTVSPCFFEEKGISDEILFDVLAHNLYNYFNDHNIKKTIYVSYKEFGWSNSPTLSFKEEYGKKNEEYNPNKKYAFEYYVKWMESKNIDLNFEIEENYINYINKLYQLEINSICDIEIEEEYEL